MSTSPTQMTLKLLRDLGYEVWITENWNPHAHIRQDMFGWIDILAYNDDTVVGIQATSAGNHSDRRKKMEAEPRVSSWVKCLSRNAMIVSWGKRGAAGERKLWTPRIENLREGRWQKADIEIAAIKLKKDGKIEGHPWAKRILKEGR